jgi:hypothetical protein
MQNQSPYLINGGLYYSDEKAGLQINACTTFSGKGSLRWVRWRTDIYEMPRNVLDFNITRASGPNWKSGSAPRYP